MTIRRLSQSPALLGGGGEPSGIADAATGVKWRMLDQHPVLGVFAVLPVIKLPTGSLARHRHGNH